MFDPQAIEAFRRHVEARTVTVTAAYTIIGLLLGLIAVAALFGRDGHVNWMATIALGLLGGGLGYIMGCERAFMLRLQAQMTLFQAHIEANTQPPNGGFDSVPTLVSAPTPSLLVKAGLRVS
jgi:hypothetical protein